MLFNLKLGLFVTIAFIIMFFIKVLAIFGNKKCKEYIKK